MNRHLAISLGWSNRQRLIFQVSTGETSCFIPAVKCHTTIIRRTIRSGENHINGSDVGIWSQVNICIKVNIRQRKCRITGWIGLRLSGSCLCKSGCFRRCEIGCSCRSCRRSSGFSCSCRCCCGRSGSCWGNCTVEIGFCQQIRPILPHFCIALFTWMHAVFQIASRNINCAVNIRKFDVCSFRLLLCNQILYNRIVIIHCSLHGCNKFFWVTFIRNAISPFICTQPIIAFYRINIWNGCQIEHLSITRNIRN